MKRRPSIEHGDVELITRKLIDLREIAPGLSWREEAERLGKTPEYFEKVLTRHPEFKPEFYARPVRREDRRMVAECLRLHADDMEHEFPEITAKLRNRVREML